MPFPLGIWFKNCSVFMLLLGVVAISGVFGYVAWRGEPVIGRDIYNMLLVTPLVFVLVFVGVSGLCLMARVLFPVWKAHPFLQLILGFSLVVFSWLLLEALFMWAVRQH